MPMRSRAAATAGAIATVAALVTGAAWLLRADREPGVAVDALVIAERLEALDARLGELAQRVALMERRTAIAPLSAARSVADEPAPRAAVDVLRPSDPRAILDQYVRSFASDGDGSEYFRLLVDAWVEELVDPICALLVQPDGALPLRLALARLLAKSCLRGDPRVLEALVTVLRQNGTTGLANTCLQTWAKLADARSAAGLEAALWQVSDGDVRRNALRVLLRAHGEGANQALLRLLASAPDETAQVLVVQALEGSDLESALALFERVSRSTQPVRLAGAQRIGDFDHEPCQRFVDAWLGFETDPQVRAALGAAKTKQRAAANWSAMQAAGPPDAEPDRDDPKAWAPRDPEMGRQWLELRYASADRISGVRIFEVNAKGSVCEVAARDAAGQWHVLWSGRATAPPRQPLALSFPATGFATQVVRVVLDTDRTPGWNEVDAVELLGAAGGQWAKSATASSSYAQRGPSASEPVDLGNGMRIPGRR